MIIWLNGPFGAGKTTVSKALLAQRPALVVLDPEILGVALRSALMRRYPVGDFQEWPAWRRLVVAALSEITAAGVEDVVVPQTVLVEEFWLDLHRGLSENGLEVLALTLHVDAMEHASRIEGDRTGEGEADEAVAQWRRLRRSDYSAATPWLVDLTEVIDTTHLDAEGVAERVLEAITARQSVR